MPITIPRRITSLANRVLDDGDIHDGTTLEFHVNNDDDQIQEEEHSPLKPLSPRQKQQFSSTVVESNPLYPPPSRTITNEQQQQQQPPLPEQYPKRKSLSEPTLSPQHSHSHRALGHSIPNHKTTRSADNVTTNQTSSSKRSSTAKCLIRKTFFLFRNRHGRRTAKEVPQQQSPSQPQTSFGNPHHDDTTSVRSMSQMGYSVQDLDGYDEYQEDDDSKSHWDIDSLSNNGGRTVVVPTDSPTNTATATTDEEDCSPSSKRSTRSCRKDVGRGDSLLQRQHAVVLCRPSTANLLEEEEDDDTEQTDVIHEMPSLVLSSQASIPEYGSDSESNPRIQSSKPRLVRELSGLTQNTFDVSWADPFEMDQHFRTVTKRPTKYTHTSQAKSPPPKPQPYPQQQREYSTDTTDDLSISSDPGGKLVAVEFEFSLDDDDDEEDHHHHELLRHRPHNNNHNNNKHTMGFVNDDQDDHGVLSQDNNYHLYGAAAGGGSGAPTPHMSQSEPHHRHGYPPKLRYGTLHSMVVQDHTTTPQEAKPTTPMSGPTTSSGSVGLVSSGFSSLRDSTTTTTTTTTTSSLSSQKQQPHPQLMMQQQKQMNSSSLEIPMPSHLSSSIVHYQQQTNTYDSSIPLPRATTSPSKHNLLDDEDGDYDNANSYNNNNTAMLWKKPKSPNNRVTFVEDDDEEEQTSPLVSSSSSPPNNNNNQSRRPHKSSSPVHFAAPLESSVSMTSSLEPSVSMSSSLEPSTSPQPLRRRISPTLENIITECPPSPPTKRNSVYKTNSELSIQPENEQPQQPQTQEEFHPKKTPANLHGTSLSLPLSSPPLPSPPPSRMYASLDNAKMNTRGQQHVQQQLPLRSPRRGLEDNDEMVKPNIPSRRAVSHSERRIVDHKNNGTTVTRPSPMASRFKTT